MLNPSHCQICLRPIKLVRGLIAHHGYQRPGQGWQTASCLGAKHQHVEVSNARMGAVALLLITWAAQHEAAAANLIASPPETMRRSASWNRRAEDVARPEGFNPRAPQTFGLYGGLFMDAVSRAKCAARDQRAFAAELEARAAAWKPAAVV